MSKYEYDPQNTIWYIEEYTSWIQDGCPKRKVVYLHLENSQLTSLHPSIDKISSLRGIDLQNNHLTSLPESFVNLSHLQYLYLENNKLTSLPESFGKLSSLRFLCLDNNQLTSLPESFGNLPCLRFLCLIGNCMTEVPCIADYLIKDKDKLYIQIYKKHHEKRRLRAQKIIYNWWIPICYNPFINPERTARLALASYKESFSDE